MRPWQYEWLAAALLRNRPGFDGGWPWWLACDEPDLERERSRPLPGGVEQALIELEIPEHRLATFPLWIWETIHAGRYVAQDRRALDSWYRDLRVAVPDRSVWPLPEPWRSQIESSWELLFDPSVDPRCWYRDDDLPHAGHELHILMGNASGGMAGLTQELLASDTVRVIEFTTSVG